MICAATHCDLSKLFDTQNEPLPCETPFGAVCSGGSSATTSLSAWTACTSFSAYRYCNGAPGLYSCLRPPETPDAAEVWELFRRASLLPFVSRLECDNGI